jgi:hypothetical protein
VYIQWSVILKLNLLTPCPAKFQVRDEVLSLKTKDVTMCCLFRAITHLRVGSNGRMMTYRGKCKKYGEEPAPVPLEPPIISLEVTWDSI